MIAYEKYVELLSKNITDMSQPSAKVWITSKDFAQTQVFEEAQAVDWASCSCK